MTGSAATLRSPGGGCRSAAGSLRLGLEATPAAPAAGRTTAGARKRAPRGVDLRSRDARDDGVSDGELSRDHLRDAAVGNTRLDLDRVRLGLDRRELVHGLLGGRAGLSAPAAPTASSPSAASRGSPGAPSRAPAAAGLVDLPRHGCGSSARAEVGRALLGRRRRLFLRPE